MVTTFNGLLDRIQEAFRVQKMFLANISHEMRSPLQAMMTGIENTLSRDRSEQEYRQRMVSLLDDLRDLNRVADNLMTLAKEESDQTIVLFKSFRIDDLIWQSRASLVKMHPEYQVLFEIASLPEEEAALSRQGNELLLKTALLNLMDNGCKFSPDHSVMVRLSWEKGCPVIAIRDHGPGIPEEERGRILTPFYRVPATAHVRGSGVGLALVRGILDLHHIRLDIGDHADGGAEFRLWFPAA